jgi:trehalose 2-sulfotransferase
VHPALVLYENFAVDPRTSTLNLLERLGLEAPPGVSVDAQMRRQSDGINDDWVRRFSEQRLADEQGQRRVCTRTRSTGLRVPASPIATTR